jgi:exonuclease V
VEGNLVNGIIDSVSYDNPNPEFEEELSKRGSQPGTQSGITDYFPSPTSEIIGKDTTRKIYLADVKTRGSAKPVSAAQLRPSKIQLLLYHRILSEMAAGKLDFFKVVRRYGVDVDDTFSDTFIAQIGSLHDEIFMDAPSNSADVSEETSREAAHSDSSDWVPSAPEPDLLRYRTIRELIPLVQHEISLTFPHGEGSLGHMLRLQYVHRSDGRELDLHDFPVSKQALDDYLESYMGWWRGERKATGVDIEEAFKCQICEFAPSCSWRRGMDEARVKRATHRLRGAGRSVV